MNQMDKKGAVGGQAKQRRSESRSRAAGEAMNGGASARSLARWCPTPYNTGRRGLCHPFRLTDKTETIIGKANKRRPIKR